MAKREDIVFELQWFPYQLHPEAPVDGYPYWEKLEDKYGRERVEQIFDHLTSAGEASGIHFKFQDIERGANTLQAHRLLDFAWQRGMQNQLVEALFNAYFCEAKFIGDMAVLSKIAGDVGLDRGEIDTFLAGDECTQRVKDQIVFARQSGITGVPSFSFDGKFVISGGQAVEVFDRVIDTTNQQADFSET